MQCNNLDVTSRDRVEVPEEYILRVSPPQQTDGRQAAPDEREAVAGLSH